MKINQMVALVDEMIEILKHNENKLNQCKKKGYKGFDPEYKDWQTYLEETKGALEALNDVGNEKLEKACEYFCLMNLVHGANSDEFYLCKLTKVCPVNPFSGLIDCTIFLSTKYNLKGIETSDYYLRMFETLFSELQSETRINPGLGLCC